MSPTELSDRESGQAFQITLNRKSFRGGESVTPRDLEKYSEV